MNRSGRSTSSRKTTMPVAKRRGHGPQDLKVSTKKTKRQIEPPEQPEIMNPPQADMLAKEYVHNLEQQLYFLEAEIRFLHDRSGVDEKNLDETSVDAAIRRLRRAIAMHEEETNKKLEKLTNEIKEQEEEIENIDENIGEERLQIADEKEKENVNTLCETFVDDARKIIMKQIVHDHYDNVADFLEKTKDNLLRSAEEYKARRATAEEDLRQINKRLDDIRAARKTIIIKVNESVRNKRQFEEEAEILNILEHEEEQPPPNTPVTAINAQNAKVEKDLEAAKATRDEIKEQIEQLLEKNVKLKAEYNIVTAKVERARAIKGQMEKQFAGKLSEAKKDNEKRKVELANIKKARKQVKEQIEAQRAQIEANIALTNKYMQEKVLLVDVVNFKREQISKIDAENETTAGIIQVLKEETEQMQLSIDELAKMLTEASEKHKHIETLVNINKQDERCQLDKLPPELTQLYESLTAVNGAISEK